MIDLPELAAGRRIISNGSNSAWAHQLSRPIDFDDCRRAEGFLQVTIGCPVVDLAISFPFRLAGRLIQGNNVLDIDSVEMDEKQISVQDWRRTRGAVVIAREVASGPDRPPCRRVQAGGAVAC